MTKPDEPAFPPALEARSIDGNLFIPAYGLTKREYFAGLALQGILNAAQVFDYKKQPRESIHGAAVRIAVALAEVLIAELNREKP